MSVVNVLNDLKARKFKPIYLLHGDEPYYIDLISNYIEAHALSDAEKGFNQTILYGKDSDLMTILNAAKRFPMMSQHQVVIVKEAQDFKWGKDEDDKKKDSDPLLGYLNNPASTTILVFCYKYGKFDKRKKTYKAIEKNGLIFESSAIYESKIPAWIEEYVAGKGFKIEARASALLGEYLGNDLSKTANELDKLMLNFQQGYQINTEDIQNNIGISKEYNVFELQTAITKRDILKANQIINYFSSNPKSNPIPLVLGNLNNYFTKILKYHYVADKSAQNLAKQLGVNPYFIKEYEVAGKSYNANKVFSIISYLREFDLKTKGVESTGSVKDGELLKELLFKIIH